MVADRVGMMGHRDKSGRLRARWAAALLAAGATGALVRFGLPLTPEIAKYGGDVVWAAAWTFLILTLWPRAGVMVAAGTAIVLCTVIELFQLTGIPARWAARGLIFRLVLGTTFGWRELLCYPAGAVIAAGAACMLAPASRRHGGGDTLNDAIPPHR